MGPNLRKKIANTKAEPNFLTRAKIRIDDIMNSYQAQTDNTTIQKPLETNTQVNKFQPIQTNDSDASKRLTNQDSNKIPKIQVKDNRTVSPTTGEVLNPNKDLKTGNYRKDVIEGVVNAAIRHGVNPYHALGIGLQESGLNWEETGHVLSWDLPDLGYTPEQIENMSKSEQEGNLLVGAMVKHAENAKAKGYKDDVWKLQAYNGFGKLGKNTEKGISQSGNINGVKKWYGIDVSKEPLDLSKNPAYGKTILSLANMLQENPQIKQIVDSMTQDYTDFKKNLDQH